MSCRQYAAGSQARSGWVLLHSVRSLPVQPDWQARKRWLALRSVAQPVNAFRFTKTAVARHPMCS
jgi:hypothetical protein